MATTDDLLEQISQLPKPELSWVAGYCNALLEETLALEEDGDPVEELIGFLEGIELKRDPQDLRLEHILEKHGPKD